MPKKKKIFISWSAEKSFVYADTISKIIQEVFGNNVKVFVSYNMRTGTMWYSELKQRLSTTDLGILILTEENINSQWQMFEAGAIFQTAPLFPVLFGRDLEEIESPISKMQTLWSFSKKKLKRLLKDINSALKTNYTDQVVDDYVEQNWNKWQRKFIIDPARKSPKTILGIQEIKDGAFWFQKNYSYLIKNSDLIVGLNFAGAIIAPILSHSCAKPVDFIWLKQENTEIESDETTKLEKISIHNGNAYNNESDKKNKKNILLVDGKYKSGESLKKAIQEIKNNYNALKTLSIFVALFYVKKTEIKKLRNSEEHKEKSDIDIVNIIFEDKINKITTDIATDPVFHKYTIWDGKNDTITEELDPYKGY